jgi:O-methyltransferase domain
MRLARGVLFDAEPVVAGAPAVLDVAGVADRTAVVGGSFFESVPLGGDAYVLKDIVHDWDESKVLEILRNVRNAVSAGAKLLVIEAVIHPTTIASICPNCWIWKCWSPAPGKERTAAEYTHLLNRAGFCNTRVIPTVAPVSVVESEAA